MNNKSNCSTVSLQEYFVFYSKMNFVLFFIFRTSLFIISSFIYAKLLVVVCIAYVISDVITHNLPLYYYEGFFTYLYGMSILFLLYVFCFLLQGTLARHFFILYNIYKHYKILLGSLFLILQKAHAAVVVLQNPNPHPKKRNRRKKKKRRPKIKMEKKEKMARTERKTAKKMEKIRRKIRKKIPERIRLPKKIKSRVSSRYKKIIYITSSKSSAHPTHCL